MHDACMSDGGRYSMKDRLRVMSASFELVTRLWFCRYVQGVSENTDTFLSLPALVFITPQTSLGARFDP